jgi:hypothetical protein
MINFITTHQWDRRRFHAVSRAYKVISCLAFPYYTSTSDKIYLKVSLVLKQLLQECEIHENTEEVTSYILPGGASGRVLRLGRVGGGLCQPFLNSE